MTTYHTRNPLGSTAVKDLYDNAENLDHRENDTDNEEWGDRFGVPRLTWYGIEQRHERQQQEFDQEFQQFLLNSGYEDLGDYAAGLSITSRNQVFRYNGELYRASASVDLPYTTTGDWVAEGGNFVSVGDAALRQELTQPTGASMPGFQQDDASTPTNVQTRLRTLAFDSASSMIGSNEPSIGAGTRWDAGPYNYIETSGAYNVLTGAGAKLVAAIDNTGAFNAAALGTVGNGISAPLGTRYGTLAAAQAAFPGCHAAGLITSLDDEIDWACIQESFIAAENLANRPTVRIGALKGSGIHFINRRLVQGGAGKGITILGTDFRTGQQGSQRKGTTLRYTGNPSTPEEMLRIAGTFSELVNLAFENTGNAKNAVLFTGATSTAGAGRSHMRHISVQEGAVGSGFSTPFSQGPFAVVNGIDYTEWYNLEIATASPHILFYDGGGLTSGGTTRMLLHGSVISLIGDVYRQAIYITRANIENFEVAHTSFNNYSPNEPCIIFDCDNIDPDGVGFDVDVLTFRTCEFDGLSTNPSTRMARLTNVSTFTMENCQTQNVTAVQTAQVDLRNSTAVAEGNAFYAINGPVFNCRDAVSRVRGRHNKFSGVRGLVNGSLAGNIIKLSQAAAVSLTGADVNNENQAYELEITSNASLTISARTYADTPPGRWLQGQMVSLRIYNTGGVTLAGLNWGAGIKAAAFGTLPSGVGRTINFMWTGAALVETSRSGDVPN